MKAMILAAGVGTRLDPLTLQLPKPLVPVANIPVMQHILRLLSEHGFKEGCANLHYMPNLILDYFQTNKEIDIDIKYLVEEKLSGDAGGVRACSDFLRDGTFLVIMGDLLTNADLSYLIAQHKAKGALASIALKTVEDVSQLGVAIVDKNGWIKEFQEKPTAQEARSNLASTGIYILEPEIFDFIPPTGGYGFGKQLFPGLVSKNLPVLGIEIDCYWSDVGTLEQYRKANFDTLSGKIGEDKLLQSGQYLAANIWAGHNSKVDASSLTEGRLLIGNNSTISPGARLSGQVIIGDNCFIEPGAIIKDSIVWSGSSIGQNAIIVNSVLGLMSKIETNTVLSETTFVMPNKSKDVCEVPCS